MSSTEYVYSLSSYPTIVAHGLRSIRSLLSTNNVEPSDIHVYFTPPVDASDITLFERLGVTVHERDTAFPGGFRTRLGSSKGGYAEKWWLTERDADTVVFLDCDTVIVDDLMDVVDGSFELKARPIDASDRDRFRSLFISAGQKPQDWYPNTGFLIFKNGLHKRIREDWKKFIQSELPYYSEGFTKEQYALALATSDCAFEPMTPDEHVMEWLGETPHNGYVHHLKDGKNSFGSMVLNSIDSRLPKNIKNYLINNFPVIYDEII